MSDLPPINPLAAAHHGVPEKAGAREMLPAMNAAEWARVLEYQHFPAPQGGGAHARIARALYGQPFGFTREDVKLLRMVADDNRVWRMVAGIETDSHLDALADRIAALLPPEP